MVSDMHDAGHMTSDVSEMAPETAPSETSSVFRTRVIPIIAGSLVVGLLGLLTYALFAPESMRVDARQTVTDFGAVVYDEPRPAPDFELANFDGSTFRLSDHRGDVVVLNFWASWCGPCIAEMPMLNRTADEFADDGVVIVGVNVWDSRSAATRFVDDLNITYPIVEDDIATSIAVEYGLTGVPETFVLNAEGEIVTFFRGEFTNAQQIRDMIALSR
jgi:cytochrome c biogenesis protein CcmG, thiol:disulfide interchange protein DsbE